MEISLPVIPLGVLTLMNLVAPYAIALINQPSWPAKWKRTVAVGVSVLLAGVVLAGYYWVTGERIPDWSALILLSIITTQAAYTQLYKSATRVEGRHGLTDPPAHG